MSTLRVNVGPHRVQLVKNFERGAASSDLATSVLFLIVWRLAERVGFETLPDIENKELKGVPVPHDPPDPHESPGRDTF
jgi:hypothetical protein